MSSVRLRPHVRKVPLPGHEQEGKKKNLVKSNTRSGNHRHTEKVKLRRRRRASPGRTAAASSILYSTGWTRRPWR